MIISEIIALTKTSLTSLLTDITVTEDISLDLKGKLPVIMIEADNSDFSTAMGGRVYEQTHNVTFTIIVSAQGKPYIAFKGEVANRLKALLGALGTIDIGGLTYFPQKVSYSEVMIGSEKGSAAVLEVRIEDCAS